MTEAKYAIPKPPLAPRLTASQRRESIIQAAIKLFSSKGFRGTTTRELAAAVGVSEPVLYQHFQTKRDLYLAIIEWKSAEMDATYAVLSEPAADDRTFFLQLGQQVWHWYERDVELSRLLFFSALESQATPATPPPDCSSPDFSDLFFARHATKFFETVVAYIQQQVDAGRYRSDIEAFLAARAFIGMIGHYAMSKSIFRFDPVPCDSTRVIEAMVDLFLSGVIKS